MGEVEAIKMEPIEVEVPGPELEQEEPSVVQAPPRRRRRGIRSRKPEELQTIEKIETVVKPVEVKTGEQISDTSAENILANMPATTENNIVNQVSNSTTQNSGNSTTTVIQGHRPSRTGDFLASGYGSFAR